MPHPTNPDDSRAVWQAFEAGHPTRVPVTLYADARIWLADPANNRDGLRLTDYLRDPDLMAEIQARAREWFDTSLLSDDPPADQGWPLIVDCQNYLEMAWLGGTVDFDRDEPHAPPFLSDDRKYAFVDAEPPGAFDGIGGHVLSTYEHFQEMRRSGWSHAGKGIGSISMPFNTTGTDGPFTIACGIRGTTEFLLDMIEDPDYARALLDWITEAVIRRIRAVRAYLGEPALAPSYGCADDSIVLLSVDMYRDFVLPCHRRILDSLTEPGGFRSMHLCGDAQRFFPVLQRELGVMQFDTGFPIDFARLYDELHPATRILGGPSIALLRDGTLAQVEAEVRRILRSGVMEKSRGFILREANSLAPLTPLENVNAIFRTCLREGVYPQGGPA